MLEKALSGSKLYWGWIAALLALIAVGFCVYLYQLQEGLGITGLSRDVPWGFYIAQFTFLVGVAASAVMVVLPYYLHHYKAFGKITILGEFVAISAVIMCLTFIIVDMGQPYRVMNTLLHPTPNSLIFWDIMVLNGYLVLNIVISRITFSAERKGVPPAKWIKPLIYLSIPWAISIHTVTAFLYAGLGARPFWLTAILAPRFLASAFATGPALLILLCLLLRKLTKFDAGDEPLKKLAEIATYAMIVNVFFVLMEIFTALYSNIPEHAHHFEYLFLGIDGYAKLAPFMWVSELLAITALVLLIVPSFRRNTKLLVVACLAVVFSLWIDKGLGMVVTGFVPNPFGKITEYSPTLPELTITAAIYAIGFLVLTILYKVAVSVREETRRL
ncbi:MAG: menaquinol oxidoreductase [Myxococcales bacterium]|nr:MAG: menaquinol oxidoreductase [Myxococcales bacterium]